MNLNRRATIRLLTAAGAGAQLMSAQTPTAAASASVDADLQSARQALRDEAQRIALVKLPRATEPAFRFQA